MSSKQLIGYIYKSYLRNENQKNPSTKNQVRFQKSKFLLSESVRIYFDGTLVKDQVSKGPEWCVAIIWRSSFYSLDYI